tara:strand:- start:1714 stop:2967 length:1254 start_codon:yes stop_codon:yes gene_type:complete
MTKKKKILVVADSPLAPSGVGTQTKYMIEGMLRTNEFSFVCLAGAIRHNSYKPMKVDPYGDDWVIHPVDGYGNPQIMRDVIQHYKPDMLWFMTDPRFYIWLWQMEDEIRPHIPMIYYHVWDNYPYPLYNKKYYDSNDVVCTISKVTDDIVRTVSPEVECIRIQHAVDTSIFKKREKSEYQGFVDRAKSEGKMVFFWNNRNARRKQSGTLIFWFKEFLDKVGHDKAMLIMHTEPKDPNGQDLGTVIEMLDLDKGQVVISTEKVPPDQLSCFYNLADCTINIADAEGFGLGTLESLACETPIIVNMTGGLQEQVTDGEDNWFGIGIQPASKAVIGSQDVPYIYEDRISKEDFLEAMEDFYNMPEEQRLKMGSEGRKYVLKNYSLSTYVGSWYQTLNSIFEKYGSWENRKNYKKWEMCEL